MHPVQIREFHDDDMHSVVSMWRESFEHGVGIADPHPIDGQIEYFRNEILSKSRVRIALQGQLIVGVLASTATSVTQLYIRVQNIRTGIGSRLLNLAKSESSGSLWLFTFKRNLRACAFYESQGFVVACRGFEPFWQLEDVKYIWVRPNGDA